MQYPIGSMKQIFYFLGAHEEVGSVSGYYLGK
jgi:hypothetical protein